MLGRGDCGQIAPSKRADIAIWDVSGIECAGSWDPAAIQLAGPTRVRDLFADGRRVVQDGVITTIDLPLVIERQNRLARTLIEKS